MPLEVRYENAWVRVYQIDGILYRDSKYRTYDCDRSSDDFVHAWRTAEPELREDLKAAYAYLYDDNAAKAIIEAISEMDPRQAEELLELRRSPPPDDAVLKALFLEAVETGGIPGRVIGENRWFRAYLNPSGFFFDKTPSPAPTITFEEYRALHQAAESQAYKDAINAFFALPRGRIADQVTFARVYKSAG